MKHLVCEMCGSTDLVKQDGVFVCQTCGTKYSVEEARKMMVEGTVEVTGTVKIDNTAKVDTYYELARRAWDGKNYDKAGEYYSQLLIEKPDDWEASFYSTLCQAATSKIIEIESIALLVRNNIPAVFSLAKRSATPETVYEKIIEDSIMIANLLFYAAKNSYSDRAVQLDNIYPRLTAIPASHYDTVLQLMKEFAGRYAACLQLLMECGSQFELLYEDTQIENYKDYALKAWKSAHSFESAAIKALHFRVHNDYVGNLYSPKLYAVSDDMKKLSAPILEKIIQYEPDYIELSSTNAKVGVDENDFEKLLDFQLAELNRKSGAGGCYIATAVYGSYDCPEVWTLRRYRDYTLAETWYGRAFIHIYYAISPTLVKWFGHTKWFKKLWQKRLDKMVTYLNNRGVENTPYADRNW